MPLAMVLDLARNAVTLGLVLAAPLLAVALVVGLLVSVVQAVTSIQEQTLSFVPKLFAMALVFMLSLSWMLQSLMRYATELFRSLPSLIN